MKIAFIGGGYVGLVSSVCFSDLGNSVTCIENNPLKFNALNDGRIPFYEPELRDKFIKNVQLNRLAIKSDLDESIFDHDIIFLAVGTPMSDDGEADLSHLFSAVDSLSSLGQRYPFKSNVIIATKSTVPVGTGRIIEQKLAHVSLLEHITVASSPEFLREGSAVHDFFHPDRIVIGCDDVSAFNVFERLYSPICRNSRPILNVGIETAELSKYAANAMLATKISFINEMSRLCDRVGADISDVAKIMGLDGRIGKYFLNPSPGYGGSCFPKDTYALNHTANSYELDVKVVKASIDANNDQVDYCFKKAEQLIGELNSSKTVALLGCSFKPNTDDIRDSASITMIQKLLDKECRIHVTDPEALDNVRGIFGDQLHYFQTSYEAAQDSDAILLMTEWHDYRHLDLKRLANSMRGHVFLDFRLLYTANELQDAGFECYVLGKHDPTRSLSETIQ